MQDEARKMIKLMRPLARKFGWTGHVDSYDSFVHAFESFRNAKQIP